jgi:exopolysaccharide biosynthesis protein
MNTNIAQTDPIPFQPRTKVGPAPLSFPFAQFAPAFTPQVSRYASCILRRLFRHSALLAHARSLALLALVFLPLTAALGGPAIGPWVPIFKGIEHAVGTNDPNIAGNFPELQVVHCLRVDLTDPDVQFFTTPRASNYVAESRETLNLSVPHFLAQNKLQVAADANFYNVSPGGADPTSEGLPSEVYGLQISTGEVVSAETSADYAGVPRAASLLFTTNKQPMFVFKNLPPGTNTAGIYTALTGFYPIVSNGVNFGIAASNSYPDSSIHQVQPRTAYGVSQDNHYFFIMTIDGRQSGYSDGALDVETGYWMLNCGAWNAINMDGGGSTALYIADSIGNPVAVNHSSYLAGYGRERYIGSHLGVIAKPVPGFFTNITVLPADTAATITWTTISAATTQLAYDTTTNLTLLTASNATLMTSHAVLLTNLTPITSYYYAPLASIGTNVYISPAYLFTTTNYVTTNPLFDFTNIWIYTTNNLDGVNWTAGGYDDSGWEGSGPGLLWVDNRGPNTDIPGLNTEMMYNPNDPNGYPFITYYFRTHFNFTNSPAGVAIQMQAYVDDGAIFYLNGAQIWNLRMPSPPVLNSTLASGYPCNGDATCIDASYVSGPVITNSLVTGDNVLAVEVHNYNAASPDITFGLAISASVPFTMNPTLSVVGNNRTIVLSWAKGGFTLQQANAVTGPWTDVPGPVISSPLTISNSTNAQYFRLIK